jgi:hypothetical protein
MLSVLYMGTNVVDQWMHCKDDVVGEIAAQQDDVTKNRQWKHKCFNQKRGFGVALPQTEGGGGEAGWLGADDTKHLLPKLLKLKFSVILSLVPGCPPPDLPVLDNHTTVGYISLQVYHSGSTSQGLPIQIFFMPTIAGLNASCCVSLS